MNKKEKEISNELCIDFLDHQTVNIKSISENNNYKFSFDRAFDFNISQKDIYEFAAKNIVDSVLEGFNGTIFAYGQTSSGKTFTMQGVSDDPELEGIIPRIIRYIFERIETLTDKNYEYVVKVSILEIYNEKIRDLIDLKRTNLQIREDKSRGIFIEDLSEHNMQNSNKVLDVMKKGLDNRAVNPTNMNENSSRSHSMVILNIVQNNLKDLSAKAGKLYLVDLAGSEKISKTGAKGQVLDEAKSINKSLTTLGLVIKALTDSKQGHIPYRESKLTRVLQESLGGNSKTCLIITCSPSIFNEAETLSTLRFGIRAKKVKNMATVNKEYSIQELKTEVNKLEGQLGKFKDRIEILEEFLMKNGIPLPSDEMKLNNINNQPAINIDIVNNNLKQDEDASKSHKTEDKEDNLNRTIIHEDEIIQINNRYIEVLHIVNSLENEKNELQIELNKARERIKDINIEPYKKEDLYAELDDMKVVSEKKVVEMGKEISKMKKHIENNKHNLTIIEAGYDSDYDINDKFENNLANKDIDTIYILEELEEKPEYYNMKSFGKIDDETNLLSTNTISVANNIESQSNTTNNNFFQNESPFVKNTNNANNLNTDAFKELIDKLKIISNTNPELNDIINVYEEKLLTNNSGHYRSENDNSPRFNMLNDIKSNDNNKINVSKDIVLRHDDHSLIKSADNIGKKKICSNTPSMDFNYSDRNPFLKSLDENFKNSINNVSDNNIRLSDSNRKEEIAVRKRDTISEKAQIVVSDDKFRKRNLTFMKEIFNNRNMNK